MMGNKNVFSNPALQKKAPAKSNFNLVPNTTNFNSIFQVKPLEKPESSLIENLLAAGSGPESHTKSQVLADTNTLKNLTAEIKAIGKQGVLLMGERVAKAREILQSYHNGTFTKWLDSTFGSKKTGYNMLTYYDFYLALSEVDLKEKFQKLPQKIAYMLASRQGDMKKKEAIVRDYDEQECTDLISIIHEKLPIKVEDKRSHKDGSLAYILKLKTELKLILQKKKKISEEGRGALEDLRDMIDSLLATPSKKNKH